MFSCDGVVKATKMAKINSNTTQNMINAFVDNSATICTDEATIYKSIVGYKQLSVNYFAGKFVNGRTSTNGIESVWTLLKRGYNGIFHHLSKKHIQRYVDEFVFRLNQGNVKGHTWDRIKSMVMGVIGKRLTYNRLTGVDLVESNI